MYESQRDQVISIWDALADLAWARGDTALAKQRLLNADTQRWIRDGAGHGRHG